MKKNMTDFSYSNLGISAIQGAIIGVITRIIVDITVKLVKWIMLAQFIFLKFLESREIIIVDWGKLSFGILEVSQELGNQATTLLITILETGSFGVGFFGGYTLKTRFTLNPIKN